MREFFARLNVFAAIARIERKVDIIMDQDATLTASVTQITTDLATEAADIKTLLSDYAAAQTAAGNTPDPAVTSAIAALGTLDASIQTADASIKAAIAPPTAAAPTPAATAAPAEAAPATDAPASTS